jgi:hypothetical protein
VAASAAEQQRRSSRCDLPSLDFVTTIDISARAGASRNEFATSTKLSADRRRDPPALPDLAELAIETE